MKQHRIRRIYQQDALEPETIMTGLTLEQAQEYCRSSEASSKTATSRWARAITDMWGPWFDTYTEDTND
jgi:hypothetical protein